jgi:hypothetical protein
MMASRCETSAQPGNHVGRQSIDTPALLQAIEELPPKCRFALGSILDGATHADVAERLKITPEKAERLFCRAVEHLMEKACKC